MIWLFCMAVALVVFCIGAYAAWDDGDGEFFAMGTFTAFVIVVFASLACTLPFGSGEYEFDWSHEHHVVTLQDNAGTSGEISGFLFFISGSVGGTLNITYYEKDPATGAITPNTLDTEDENVKIFQEGPNAEPRVVEINEDQIAHPPHVVFPWDFFNDERTRWEFHVPDGTVKENLSLDAK